MNARSLFLTVSLLVTAARAANPTGSASNQIIPLPGVEGRFDHFSVDVKNERLFVAALGNNTVEVIDLKAGKRESSINGVKEPQGLRFVPETGRLFVANGGDGTCRAYDTSTMKLLASINLGDDADNLRYDPDTKRIYVGYGSGALAAIDAEKLTKLGEVKLPVHPESFQLETKGTRIFVNLPRSRQIAVIDRTSLKVIATWPVQEAKDNYPMSLDEKGRRLFVGCRRPARLLMLSADSGETIASADCCGDTDDLFYDSRADRVYVVGGEGYVDVFDCSAKRLKRLVHVSTAEGARTALFVPELRTLFVAVPHRGAQEAEIKAFHIERLETAGPGQ